MCVSLSTFLVVAFSYYFFDGYSYATGMATYVKNNNIRSVPEERREQCWDSVKNESEELWEALKSLSFEDIVLESADVIHSVIKYLIITYTSEHIHTHWLCWYAVFVVALPATVKLSHRQKTYGCIRNHQNPNNCNHICDVKKMT